MVSILGANSVSGGYEVSNSVRLNDAYLSRTPSSAGNRRTYTISTWVKRSKFGGDQTIFGSAPTTSVYAHLVFDADDIKFDDYNGGTQAALRTSGVHRDPSAWYHIVLAVDTTQGTESNRLKLYVNGVEPTLDGKSCTQNHESQINNTTAQSVGTLASAYVSGYYFGGYVAETHFIDGAAKAQTDFGEFNDNGVWIPKKYTGTYGTNGFYLQYKQTGTSQNASGIGADTSGQGNHFAVTSLAATDVTEDTCTNNFATMNPLESARQQGGAATFAEGNLQITTSYVDANYQRYPQVYSTQAVSSGKWYFEMKIADSDTDSSMGIHSPDNYSSDTTTNPYGGYATTSCIYTSRGAVRINDGNNQGHGTWSQNDIIGCALDIDNDKVYFHKNGTYIQSGDPAGNSGGQAIPSNTTYGFTVGADAASDSGIIQVNFGNPIHTISSGNADANGYGNFEYAPPSGFFALCTKNLAEFG